MKTKLNKLFITVASMLLVVCTSFCLTACFGSDNKNHDTSPKEYLIQYTDGDSNKQITVTQGEPYKLEVVPDKIGYEFQGLFDAETGGTQYVNKTGISLTPYNEGKSIVLYAQWKEKDYTVILDYQNGSVTGSRQLTVSYDSSLPELPKNSAKAHAIFMGWYTEPNCEGVQVADQYGLIPLVSELTAENFDITAKAIYLYAGFEAEKYAVTCYFEDGMKAEVVQVGYDTPVDQIVTKTRVNNNGVVSWSKYSDKATVFDDNITEDTVLWAVEYAPVIDFDTDGGKEVKSLIARSNTTIELPTATKTNYQFMGWQDAAGNKVTYTQMPEDSTTLKAIWQPMIVFDTNGGSAVENISVLVGDPITLPTPKRNGLIFAGWYTADKQLFNENAMPANGVTLRAGWYKELTKTVVVVSASSSKTTCYGYTAPGLNISGYGYRVDGYKFAFANYFKEYTDQHISIDWHLKIRSESSNNSYSAAVNFYSQYSASSAYLMEHKVFDNITSTYREITFSSDFVVNNDFYWCWYWNGSNGKDMYLIDYYYTVHYADTTNLYL